MQDCLVCNEPCIACPGLPGYYICNNPACICCAAKFRAPVVDDSVSHPAHYTWMKGVEAIDLCEQMNYNLGAAIKYLVRCDHKGNPEKDLAKAKWYIEREIERRKKLAEKK